MARGKKCPSCGYQLIAIKEVSEPKGTWVTYKCRSSTCTHTERVFEPKQ